MKRKHVRPEMPEDLHAEVEQAFGRGYDKELGRVMNQWNMHRGASRAMHHHVGQDDCLKCQTILGRIRDALAENRMLSLAPDGTPVHLETLPLPDDVAAALARLGAGLEDARPPRVDLLRKPWRTIEVAGDLTQKQQNSLNRWYGHCHNVRAEHLATPGRCGGCDYLVAELRDVLGLDATTHHAETPGGTT